MASKKMGAKGDEQRGGKKLKMSSGMVAIARRRNARLCDAWIFLSCMSDTNIQAYCCFETGPTNLVVPGIRSWATIGYFVRLLDWANVSK